MWALKPPSQDRGSPEGLDLAAVPEPEPLAQPRSRSQDREGPSFPENLLQRLPNRSSRSGQDRAAALSGSTGQDCKGPSAVADLGISTVRRKPNDLQDRGASESLRS